MRLKVNMDCLLGVMTVFLSECSFFVQRLVKFIAAYIYVPYKFAVSLLLHQLHKISDTVMKQG